MADAAGRPTYDAPGSEPARLRHTVPSLTTVRAKAGGENFPVASVLLPPKHRRHLLAVYSFARMVDDIGDAAPGNRMAQLDAVTRDLDAVFAGSPPPDRLYRNLAGTVRECDIPRAPLDRLVEANRQDQLVTRYPTFEDLREYCELSANPVGELVLRVFGAMTPERRRRSDLVCTALQLLEHCQDVAEDLRAGRIYLPAEDMELFRVREDDLRAPTANRAVRALIGFQVQRAVRALDEGSALVGSLRGPARLAVAGYVAGGWATASALTDARFDVLAGTPKPRRARIASGCAALLAGRSVR